MTITSADSTSQKSTLPTNTEPDPQSIDLNPLLVPPKDGLATRVKTFIGSRLIGTTTAVVALSLALVGGSTWNIWTTYNGFKTTVFTQFRLQSLSGTIVYLDEVLTMSARMAAASGDPKWEKRYHSFEQELDNAIKEVTGTVPESNKANSAATDAANVKLVDLETRSFDLVRKGKQKDAFQILLGPEYEAQKQIYAQGIQSVISSVRSEIDTQLQSYSQRLFASVIFACVSLLLLLVCWIAILSLIRTYIRENTQARQSLLESQTVLTKLNEDLGQQSQQVLAQEQETRQESEILQTDIERILDVVSAMEEGDLSVEAEVSDRATGLVSDTLNRLIEQLGQVLSQVLVSAQQVSTRSSNLEELAKTVSGNAIAQAQEAQRVLELTRQVQNSASSSADEVNQSNQSLSNMRSAIEQGQGELETMNLGIGVLEQGADRIVQQMKALGEFVGLAEQFVQDQGQIASLTQVLALNATLVAARASEQRDPRQFLVVAREFEAIANQVSGLAKQTNDGLLTLQQRTTQIQDVVLTIDSEVQGLGTLVSGFTTGVEQANDVFANVRVATDRVTQAGEAVAQSNQEIVSAAQLTAKAMSDIASLADRTAQLTQNTQAQAAQMENLSAQLLKTVQFFRLPESVLQVSGNAQTGASCLPEEILTHDIKAEKVEPALSLASER